MPDFATHYILGEQLRQRLTGTAARLINSNLCAFRWGLQGPDPLFFHRIFLGGGPLADHGHVMHAQKTAELFYNCACYVQQSRGSEDYEINKAYFIGFLFHYVLDKTVHPYVFFRQGALRSQLPEHLWPTLHCQIETEMDNQLYPLYYNQHILRFDPGKEYKLPRDLLRCVGAFYEAALQRVYGLEAPPKEVASSFKDTLRVARLLYDSSGWVVYYLTKLVDTLTGTPEVYCSHVKGRCSGADVLNLQHNSWHNPNSPEVTRTESVPELMQQALEETYGFAQLYLEMFATGRIEWVPFRETFSNGRLDG